MIGWNINKYQTSFNSVRELHVNVAGLQMSVDFLARLVFFLLPIPRFRLRLGLGFPFVLLLLLLDLCFTQIVVFPFLLIVFRLWLFPCFLGSRTPLFETFDIFLTQTFAELLVHLSSKTLQRRFPATFISIIVYLYIVATFVLPEDVGERGCWKIIWFLLGRFDEDFLRCGWLYHIFRISLIFFTEGCIRIYRFVLGFMLLSFINISATCAAEILLSQRFTHLRNPWMVFQLLESYPVFGAEFK